MIEEGTQIVVGIVPKLRGKYKLYSSRRKIKAIVFIWRIQGS